jgi:nucleotide-binding universal stress UspA family protein
MIQHILYPTDGSEASKTALIHLEKLSQVYQAPITLLHCYEFTMGHVLSRYDTDSAYIQEIEERFAKHGQVMLDELAQELTDKGLKIVKKAVLKGAPGPIIVRVAHEEACDLILMGTRGFGSIRSFFLGSTSHYVSNHIKDIALYLIPATETHQTAD